MRVKLEKLNRPRKNGHVGSVIDGAQPAAINLTPISGPRMKFRHGTQKALARGPGRRQQVCLAGGLLSGGDNLVKFGRALLMLGEHDIDLRIGRN